jgi:hypothetical protein
MDDVVSVIGGLLLIIVISSAIAYAYAFMWTHIPNFMIVFHILILIAVVIKTISNPKRHDV